MEKKIVRANKLFPWYSALSADLIFFVAINTVWIINVKGFTAAQMNFLSTVSSLTGIVFQIPILNLIKKIGNTKSIRIGALFLFISSLLLTFCTNYLFFIIAKVFFQISLILEMMSAILLKNNLDYLNKSDEYIDIRTKASMIYSILTVFTTLFCGVLFNMHKYLPMVSGTVICLICFIITFFIFDVDECLPQKIKEDEQKRTEKNYPEPFKWFLLIVLYYGLAFGIVVYAQQNGKLLIQNTLLEEFSIEKTTIYLSVAMFVSRVARVIGNYFFPKAYREWKNKIGIALIIILLVACLIMLAGVYVKANIYVKSVIITLGFSLIPFLRDPLKIFSQNLIFEVFEKKYHEDIFVYMSFFRNVGNFVFSLVASFVLLKFPLQYLFVFFAVLILPLIYLAILIAYKMKSLDKK